MLSNGNTTEWSPMWSVIIQVITKSKNRAENMITDRIERHFFREKKNSQVMKKGKIAIKILTKGK